MDAISIYRKLSKAYWPNPELNESANREAGNRAVDQLTVGELALFLHTYSCGPTYVMVKRHCESYPFTFNTEK